MFEYPPPEIFLDNQSGTKLTLAGWGITGPRGRRAVNPKQCLQSAEPLLQIRRRHRISMSRLPHFQFCNSMFSTRRGGSSMTPLRAIIIVSAFFVPAALTMAPASAATRHYDCSKAANANKAACKGAAAPSAGQGTPSRTIAATVKTTTTSRQYDCTKPGNARKAPCRAAAAQSPAGSSPGAVKTTTSSVATTTDCSKWFNKARAACRTSKSSTPPRTNVAPAPKPVAANSNVNASSRSTRAAANSNAQGATAQCKDGSFSHAAHHAGACSHHGGVAKWMN